MAGLEPARRPQQENRIAGFDLARALAILGMIVAHFAIIMSGEAKEPAWLQALVDLLDGRAAALFVVLAGIGVSLMTRAARGVATNSTADATEGSRAAALASARRTLVRRGLFLLAAGYVNLVV